MHSRTHPSTWCTLFSSFHTFSKTSLSWPLLSLIRCPFLRAHRYWHKTNLMSSLLWKTMNKLDCYYCRDLNPEWVLHICGRVALFSLVQMIGDQSPAKKRQEFKYWFLGSSTHQSPLWWLTQSCRTLFFLSFGLMPYSIKLNMSFTLSLFLPASVILPLLHIFTSLFFSILFLSLSLYFSLFQLFSLFLLPSGWESCFPTTANGITSPLWRLVQHNLSLFIFALKSFIIGQQYFLCGAMQTCDSLWLKENGGGPRGVMVKTMDCGIVCEFVLQSRYYVHFRANTLGKGMNPLILPAMG